MTVRGWLTKVLDLCDEGAKLDLDVRLFSYPRRIRVFYCERCQHAETIKKEPSAA